MADNESMTAPGENSAFTQSQQSIPESSETSGGATQLTESQSLTASSAISHDSTQLPKSESVPTASSGNSGSTTLPRSQSLTALTTTTKIAGNPTRSQPASNSGDASLPRSVLLTATAQIAGNPTPLPQAQSIPPSSSENSGNSTRSQSASIPTAISENAGGVQPSVTVNTTPSGGDQSSPTRDGHQVETPLLQQLRTRDERSMSRWTELVKRCHEVIAMLIGFVLIFAPVGFIIKAMKANGGEVHPVDIIVSILHNFQIHLVFPFVISGLVYALLYVLSSSDMPVAWILWMDTLSVIAGFSVVFLVIYYIAQLLSIIGAAVCGLLLVVLFWCQFPRERIVARDIERA